MTQDEIERLHAAGDTAGVEAALRQRAEQAGDYWAARSPSDAAAREFGTVPMLSRPDRLAELGLAGLRGTLFYKGYQQSRDMIGLPPADPNWKPAQRWTELSKDIPMEYHQDLMETQSEEDYLRLRARVAEKVTDQQRFASNGPAGMAAMIGGSLFDVDLLLAPLSDGAYTAAKIARTVKSARAARMIGTAIETGTVSGAVTLGYEALDDGDLDWTGVASSTMMGFVMGGAAGTLISPPTRRLWTDGAQKMRDDFHARMASEVDLGEYRESIPSTVDYKQYLAQATKAKEAVADSVGAAASPGGARSTLSTPLVNERHQAWVDLASDELAMRYGTRVKAPYRGLEEGLEKVEGYLGNVGLGSDWAQFAKSNSKIAQWIAARFLESPTGRGGRSGTAALDREMFQRRILQGMPEYQASYARWAQGQNANLVDIHWKQDLAEQFGKEVHLEMNYRRLHDTESPNAHADVKQAADALERQAKEAYDILKASGSEGFDSIKYKRGYSPLRWNGLAMRNAVASGVATKNDIIELIANGYAPALGLPMEEVRVFARALYTRAVSKADDFDTSLQNLLTADGRAFLREKLVDNGIAAKRADQIVESLSGPLEERGKAGFAKNRMEIDLSAQHNGLNLIDFTDNNLSRNWTLYARQASGNAALARAGIKNKAERGEIMDALTAEQVALNEAPLPREFMEDVFSYFDAGPVSGGVNPNISRLKKLTNLSLLNKLGIAQAAETGVTIAAVGWENFLAHAPAVRRFIKNGQAGNTDALLEELGAWTGRIWDEEKLINPEIDFNIDRMNTDDLGKFMNGLDRFLAKGQRLQGHLSLFYTIRSGQTKAAAAGIVDNLFKMLKAGTDGYKGRRFDDIGFGPDMRQALQTLVDDGTIEWQANGFIDKLNMDKWDPMLAHEFSGALTRFVHQVIQKDLIGESNVWMSKDMGALFTHLIQFPLLAMQKQAIRNTRLLDATSKATLLYGLTTAGMAYAAGQMIEGRTDKLDPISIAKGALSYSNMTGFLPMMWDPVATMFGVDDWRINRYGQHSELGLPTVDWVNKAIRLPGAIMSAMDGEIDKGDKSALKALPFANMYGSAILFNALEEDHKAANDVAFRTALGKRVSFNTPQIKQADVTGENVGAFLVQEMKKGAGQ